MIYGLSTYDVSHNYISQMYPNTIHIRETLSQPVSIKKGEKREIPWITFGPVNDSPTYIANQG